MNTPPKAQIITSTAITRASRGADAREARANVQVTPMRPDRLPLALRFGLYGLAVGVLLFLCLAPSDELPPGAERIWDKAQHATAWLVLAGLGLAFWPERPRAIAAFALVLGAVVEVLQATMGLGRNGDWHDLVADVVGVGAALAFAWLLRRLWSIQARGRRKPAAIPQTLDHNLPYAE